ncbi:MAG: hypothetical protein FJ033_13775 [Chloroflexi bacterium]|nr:hypothetical protein [Chloroflexota bacterium]
MAKLACLAAGLLVVAGFGCNSPQNVDETDPASLFPLSLGNRWVYETRITGPVVEQATTVMAVCRLETDADGDRLHLISTCMDDQIVHAQILYRIGDSIVEPVSFTGGGEQLARDPPLVLLRTRLQVGDQWRWAPARAGERPAEWYRVQNTGLVLTPLGRFEAVRVVMMQLPREGTLAGVERWYASGIGMVKESGTLTIVNQNNAARLEIVRLLVAVDRQSPDHIPCCQRAPAGMSSS